MIKTLLVLLLIFSPSANANMASHFDDIGNSKHLANVGTLLIAVDWLQTLDIERHPGDPLNPPYTKPLHETNPILGRHPTRQTINTYFLVKMAFHLWVNHSQLKTAGNVRPYWNFFSVSDTSYHVQRNYELGLQVKF